MITVYYDGKCGLCNREIEYYKRLTSTDDFNWRDLNIDSQVFIDKGYALTKGLKILHAEDAQGKMHKGVNAFILIWQNLHGWKILAQFVKFPGIKQLVQLAYHSFAWWRFKRLTHCQLALKEEQA